MERQKQVEITEEILAQIQKVTKTTVDPDNIVVFEAAALSTNPIQKPGSLYDGARPSRQLLVEAAEALNEGRESVPLHTLHLAGDEIPVGRVFYGKVHDEVDGSSSLRAMFYLPKSETDLISKINLGVLDEVSVGLKSHKALCSKCGFDYFGDDADFTHLFSHTCENDHVLGEDGAHLKLEGLDKWMELSLVSRGASDKPKILSRPKQLLSSDEYDRIAASGKPVEALVLYTSTAMETAMPEPKTEAQTFDAQAAIEALTQSVAELGTAIGALVEASAAAEEPVTETETEVEAETGPTVEDLQAELETAKQRIAELEAEEPEAETAEEEEAEEEPETAAAPELPAGGVSASAITDAQSQKQPSLRASAFKTKRR